MKKSLLIIVFTIASVAVSNAQTKTSVIPRASTQSVNTYTATQRVGNNKPFVGSVEIGSKTGTIISNGQRHTMPTPAGTFNAGTIQRQPNAATQSFIGALITGLLSAKK